MESPTQFFLPPPHPSETFSTFPQLGSGKKVHETDIKGKKRGALNRELFLFPLPRPWGRKEQHHHRTGPQPLGNTVYSIHYVLRTCQKLVCAKVGSRGVLSAICNDGTW